MDLNRYSHNHSSYAFKPWNIRHQDVESKIKDSLRSPLREGQIYPIDMMETNSKCLVLKGRLFRLAGYKNTNVNTIKFSLDQGLILEITGIDFLSIWINMGMNMKSSFITYFLDKDTKVQFKIGTEDLLYAACIFHDPVYILIINITEQTAKVYIEALSQLDAYDKKTQFDSNLFYRSFNMKNIT